MTRIGPIDAFRSRLFHGNPRLLAVSLLPALVIVGIKAVLEQDGWQPLAFSPLLTAAISAEVFVVGFLLSGTATDFKEAERLPGDIAGSLETMADECLIALHSTRPGVPEAAGQCLHQLVAIGHTVHHWLTHRTEFDALMGELRGLNTSFAAFDADGLLPGFVTRLKTEQSTIRRVVLRMDTMRRTSYVAAGYLIGEVVAVVLVLVLLATDLGPLLPTLALVGLISYLLIYVVLLIRDLDDPYEYVEGKPGPADVDLRVLVRSVRRLQDLLPEAEA